MYLSIFDMNMVYFPTQDFHDSSSYPLFAYSSILGVGPVDLQASPGLALPSGGRRGALHGARWRYPCFSVHERRRIVS